jgi:thermitase
MKNIKLYLIMLISTIAVAKLNTISVMVIDTGIDTTNAEITKYTPEKYLVPLVQDTHGHGTHITGIIASKACSGVTIIPCKFWYDNGDNNMARALLCIDQAIKERVNIINFSAGGSSFVTIENRKIAEFCKLPNTRFVSAAGNNGEDASHYYPVAYRNSCQIGVGALDESGNIWARSNKASWLVWDRGVHVESYCLHNKRCTMTGTSQATAIRTSRIVDKWCKNH